MNCVHSAKLIDAWIDKELDTATADAMSLHLYQCAACSALARQRSVTCRQLKEQAPYHRAPPALRQRVLADVESAVRRPAAGPRLTFSWQQATGVVLIALASAVGGYLLGRPTTEPPPIAEVVSSHVASLSPDGRLTDIVSSDRHTVKPWFQGKVDFAPPVRDLSEHGFVLLGGRLDHLGERQAAALVYRLRGHYVTLYVWHDFDPVPVATRLRSVRGFNVATWSDSGLHYAAVSDTNATDLLRFAALLQDQP